MTILGKPMGNGIPIAGVVAKPSVLEDFSKRARYFNTFGGIPVSCAAGLAVLEVIENERLMANAEDVGSYLREGLNKLAVLNSSIGEVRGAGLFIGMDLVEDQQARRPNPAFASRVVNGLRERHVLLSASGPHGHVLKIRPPLPFSRENADQFLVTLSQVLADQG